MPLGGEKPPPRHYILSVLDPTVQAQDAQAERPRGTAQDEFSKPSVTETLPFESCFTV